MSMRILILSFNAGEGHNSAARALKEEFELRGDYCEIVDTVSLWSRHVSDLVGKMHASVYRHAPSLFNFFYGHYDKEDTGKERATMLSKVTALGLKSLKEVMESGVFDAAIATHSMSAVALSRVREKYGINIPLFYISTDYTCHPGVNESDVDVYFIAHESTAGEFIDKGVPADRLVVSGIPVKKQFYAHMPKSEAKRLCGIPEDKRNVMIMGGSMGCGPVREVAEMLAEELPEDAMVTVICARNESLRMTLEKQSCEGRLAAIGFTDKISSYMDASDVLVTKPGGLSSTEALAKGIPMVLVDAVDGCEKHNRNFLVSCGYAKSGKEAREIADMALALLEESRAYGDERECKVPISAEVVYNTVREHVELARKSAERQNESSEQTENATV